MDQIEILGTAQVDGIEVKVAECGNLVYLLTPCCDASGKGSNAGDEFAVVCRACYKDVDAAFGDVADPRSRVEFDSFVSRYAVTLKENVMTESQNPQFTEDVVDVDPLASPKTLQAQVIADRKAMGMSRRALADSVGWTESRVWYLEQAGVRLDVQRNVEDLSTLLVHMTELRAAGWVKPTVKTAAARTPKANEGWFTKDQMDEALAASVAAAANLRTKHADQLTALRQLVNEKLTEARAKKGSTAALVQILGTVDDMVWES